MAFDANDLSPHEQYVVDRTRQGELADFSPMRGADGVKPAVRAGFLRKLMLQLEADWPVRTPGVRLRGVRIEGALDLTDCSGLPALSLESCDIPEPLIFDRAALARLSLHASAIAFVRGANARISGVLDLSGVAPLAVGADARLVLSGAQIGADILAACAKLHAPAPRAAVDIPRGAEHYALDLSNALIEGRLSCVDGFAAQGGVNLEGARVSGAFDLRGGALVAGEGPALLARGARFGDTVSLGEGFIASGEVSFEGAVMRGDLRVAQARFEGAALALDCGNARIEGEVAGGFKSEGGLRFSGAAIAGKLDLRGAEIGARRHGAAAAPIALDASAVNIRGALMLQGVNIKGEVCLADARVSGHAGFGGGRFINPGAWAIRAPNFQGGGNLILRIDDSGYAPHGQKTVVEGGARFDRAQIGGGLAWLNLELRGPGPDGKGAVLSLADASIAGPLHARALTTQQDALIDVSGASCGALDDDIKAGWGVESAALDLEGFRYGRLDNDDRWRARLSWLKRARLEGRRFSPQAYGELARLYAQAGRREDARRVLLALRDQRTLHASAGPLTWMLSSAFGLLAGYGLAPVRAARALILFLAIGVAGVLVMNAQGALVTPQGRACNAAVEPALYAVDVALPVIDFGQTQRCAPGRTARADLPAGVALGDSDWRLFEGVALWRWAQALYALLGALLAALALVTFSGALRPKSSSRP